MISNGSKKEPTQIECVARDSDCSSFAQLLDLRIVKAEPGHALAEVRISREKHLNFLGRTHGAVIFAIADHACGLCGNSLGRRSVLVHSSMNFYANPKPGSVIQADARMIHVDEISGTMVIDVQNGTGESLARCQAIVMFLK